MAQRIIGLIGIGVLALIIAVYFYYMFTTKVEIPPFFIRESRLSDVSEGGYKRKNKQNKMKLPKKKTKTKQK
jgi:hypothetical protein